MNTERVIILVLTGITVIGIALCFLRSFNKKTFTTATAVSVVPKNEDTLVSPLSGTVIALEQVRDDVFSSGILGSGIAIIPDNGELYAPTDGVIANIPESRHAIAITADSGMELLIHVGIDTVNLKGEVFTLHVREKEHVKKGQLLMNFDLAKIKDAGYDPVTPLILTEADGWNFTSVKGQIRAGDVLMSLEKGGEA